jgi:tetratricopeptide (TPR) repeat protein
MKRRTTLLLGLLAAMSVAPALAGGHKGGGDVHVRGYTKSNGTYVGPHMRSATDGKFSNNWSTRGNVNPYTGEPGTKLSPSRSSGNGVNHSTSTPSVAGQAPAQAGQVGGARHIEARTEADLRIANLTQVVNAMPGSALAVSERAFEHHQQRAFDLAIADYSKAIELDKSECRYYHNRGVVHRAKGETDRAISDFNEAIRLDPSFHKAYFGLSEAYQAKGLEAEGH